MRAKRSRAGGIADALVDTEAADQYVTEALAIYQCLGDRQGEFDALNNLGNLRSQAGDTSEARRIREELLPIARDLQDQASIATALVNLALTLLSRTTRPRRCRYSRRALFTWTLWATPSGRPE